MRMRLGVGLLVGLLTSPVFAAVFQYHHSFEYTRRDKPRTGAAFAWIPPNTEQVRGVVFAGMTLMERPFVQDPAIREACAAQQLAIIFVSNGLGSMKPTELLDAFAAKSGYAELRQAPMMFVGHSAGGPQAHRFAVEYAERCFGLVQYRGGAPTKDTRNNVSITPPGVPALMMVGQFDEFGGLMRNEDGRESWEGALGAMKHYRSADAGNLGSLVVEPGAGHFAWSQRNAAYLAMFIRKAASTLIPDKRPSDAAEAVKVKQVDVKSGWLTDLNLKSPTHEPAPYEKYSGEKGEASWHFDEAMAEATVPYHEGLTGRKDQFIKWKDPHWVDAGARYFFTKIKWIDDRTFEVHPTYREDYPSQHRGSGPHWHRSGTPVEASGEPIKVKTIGGPIEVVEPATSHRFRVVYNALSPAGGRDRATFMAYSEGNDEFRYTEHVGMLPRGFKGLKKGKAQTITFPALADVKAGGGAVDLKATSDAGLPVHYYVAYGPAKIEDGKLVIAEIPKRATFPIEVKVVAYQFGSGVEPHVKTAEPVERMLKITKSDGSTRGEAADGAGAVMQSTASERELREILVAVGQ